MARNPEKIVSDRQLTDAMLKLVKESKTIDKLDEDIYRSILMDRDNITKDDLARIHRTTVRTIDRRIEKLMIKFKRLFKEVR